MIDGKKYEDDISEEKHDYTLTSMWRTDTETGYGITIIIDGKESTESILILDVEHDEKGDRNE